MKIEHGHLDWQEFQSEAQQFLRVIASRYDDVETRRILAFLNAIVASPILARLAAGAYNALLDHLPKE
jgi:hypothetical protein